jgi:cytochrome c oxidase subunit 2
MMKKLVPRYLVLLAVVAGGGQAANSAEGRLGLAEAKQIAFQPAATDIMRQINDFHNLLLIITALIVIIVFSLLFWVMYRYNAKANPVPAKTTHNTILEIVWTAVPVMILVLIGIPSFSLLYYQQTIPEADLVIKATGHQWYWTHEYPELDQLEIHSRMLPASYFDPEMSEVMRLERQAALSELQRMHSLKALPRIYRLLDTDTRIVVPVNKTVKLLVTADDVLHAWAIPAFGIKIDAVPGRLNETWFRVEEIGTYYGQCSELCGINHAFMPIVVEVVTQAEFDAWLIRAKEYYASISSSDGKPIGVGR